MSNTALWKRGPEDSPEALRGRALGWRLLGDLLAEVPSDARIEQARAFLAALGAEPGNESGEAIRADCLHLFVGLRKTLAPPWESVHLSSDRRVFQEPTLAVRRAYLEAGLTHDGMFETPDDHISLELEFLAALNERLAAALEAGAGDDADRARSAKQHFLEAHLGRWVGAFAAQIQAHAATDFWKSTARALLALFPPAQTRQRSGAAGG